MNFISVEDFKNLTGAKELKFIASEDSGKLFVGVGTTAYKCQQNIDGTKPIKFMYKDNLFADGCFVNVTETTKYKTVFTL